MRGPCGTLHDGVDGSTPLSRHVGSNHDPCLVYAQLKEACELQAYVFLMTVCDSELHALCWGVRARS